MKKLIIVSTLVLLAISGYGQTPRTFIANDNSDTNITKNAENDNDVEQFRISELPSVMNSSNILPAGYTNFQINFNENKLSAQIGSYKNDASVLDRKFSYGGEFSCDANEKSVNLFDILDGNNEYDFSFKTTTLLASTIWRSTKDNSITTQRFMWFNAAAKYNYSIFQLYKKNNTNLTFYDTSFSGANLNLSYNFYFFSRIRGTRLMNSIGSIGANIGNNNNYSTLKKYKFKRYDNSTDTNTTTESFIKEYTATPDSLYKGGKKISLNIYGELYKYLLVRDNSSLFLSNVLKYDFANKSLSYSVGLNVNVKKEDEDKPGSKKDVVNVALVLDMPGLNQANYDLKKTGGLYLRTAIPLLFN